MGDFELGPMQNTQIMKQSTGARKKKVISSFQVFQQFITTDEVHGVPVGDQILTEACFQRWMETREHHIVYPEESFRRTLVAHIRGADGRRPFSATVEASLLNLLRSSDPKENCWDRCFPTNVSRIGKRGFNKLGFHEAKALGATDLPKVKKVIKKKIKRRFSEIQPCPPSETSLVIPTRSLSPDPTLGLSMGVEDHVLSKASSLVSFLFDLRQNMSSTQPQALLTPLLAVINSLTQCYTFDQLVDIESASVSSGKSLITPSAYFFLRQDPAAADQRLAKDYLLPPPEECYFQDFRPVGRLLFRWRSWTIVDSDNVARRLLKRNPNGLHYLQLCDSLLELLHALKDFLPLLKANGEVWYRGRLVKGDGSVGIYLMHLDNRGGEFESFCFQEQSEDFPNLLQLPLFL